MDLYRLSTSFIPDLLVEGYSSLIWTERYDTPGDFELTTYLVNQTKDQLPLDIMIGIRESREIMIVETHSIKYDENGYPQLVVKGRSFMSFFEQRGLDGAYQAPWNLQQSYMTSEALLVYMYEMIINGTGTSVLRAATSRYNGNVVPGVYISDSTTIVETRKTWAVKEGPADKAIQDFIFQGGLGLRMMRPAHVLDATAKAVTVSSTGVITRTNNSSWNARLDVYNGRDRSVDNQAQPGPYNDNRLVFSYDAGHLNTPEYLFSNKEYKNIAIVNSSIGRIVVYENPLVNPSGLLRKLLYVDGGSPTGTDTTILVQMGAAALKDHKRQILLDAAVSTNVPFKYGSDYYLGDVVWVQGDFGFYSRMQVIEYIRTQDEDGDRGYPTLILAD